MLTGSAVLAPTYQTHLGTDVPLHKHIGYGLFFAAPMAGVGFTRLMGAHFRFPQLAITLAAAMLAVGMTQSTALYTAWPNSTQLVTVLRHDLPPHGHYLADTYEVPVYYLGSDTNYAQWTSTFNID